MNFDLGFFSKNIRKAFQQISTFGLNDLGTIASIPLIFAAFILLPYLRLIISPCVTILIILWQGIARILIGLIYGIMEFLIGMTVYLRYFIRGIGPNGTVGQVVVKTPRLLLSPRVLKFSLAAILVLAAGAVIFTHGDWGTRPYSGTLQTF